MLHPDFNELIRFGKKSQHLRFNSQRKTMTTGAGDHKSPFRGQGLEFYEVRKYQPGDDVRNIDWRVTARMNQPFMKVFTEERERTVLLCVDANAGMRFGTRGTFKSIQAARATALLGSMAQSANDRVGGLVFGDIPEGLKFFEPARSRRPLWKVLKTLSNQPPEKAGKTFAMEDALATLERVAPTGSLVFIVSDFLGIKDALEKGLAALRRRCDVILICVTDLADRELPPMEPVWFTNSGGIKILAGTDNKKGRETYARQWRENREKLETIAMRQRSYIIDLQTSSDIYREIVKGLRLASIRRSRR
jgi:uncharacterized protein (DUF58 family)